jgi:hypothetical protein
VNTHGVKDRLRSQGGEVTSVGYTGVGSRRITYVEAYFDDDVAEKEFGGMEACDRVTVDVEWDEAHNGVLVEIEPRY